MFDMHTCMWLWIGSETTASFTIDLCNNMPKMGKLVGVAYVLTLRIMYGQIHITSWWEIMGNSVGESWESDE